MTPKQVFDYYGGKAPTARRLGISYQAVQEWEAKERVPRSRQFQIEVETGGKLKAEKSQPTDSPGAEDAA